MTANRGSQFGNCLSEFHQASKFLELLSASVVLVITILPATRDILAHCLQSPARSGIDGHIRPRRRNSQHVNAFKICRAHLSPVAVLIAKPALRRAQTNDSALVKLLGSSHERATGTRFVKRVAR